MRKRDRDLIESLTSRIEYLEKHCVIVSKHTSVRPASVLMFKDDADLLDEIFSRES